MAKKAKKHEKGFDTLARLIKRESDDIRKHMATKDDLKNMSTKSEVAAGFAAIMAELSDIKSRLKAVEEKVEDHSGHSKEIDHAFERIAAIERHLGIKHRVH